MQPAKQPDFFSAISMNFLHFLKNHFAAPTFKTGERVNHVRRGTISHTDGYVVAHIDKGVLVEWPRTGLCVVAPSELALIG